MIRRHEDQAAGLRQMVANQTCRSISFTGGRGGSGSTSIILNLAAALVERCRDVIVLDEFEGSTNACHRLHRPVGPDFGYVLRREANLADILVDSGYGYTVLPIAARSEAMACLNDNEQMQLSIEFELLAQNADYLLLDTRPATSHGIPGLSIATDDVVIIISNRAESLTDAYATIKLLATEYARHDFRILINRVANLEEAGAIFGRIRQVARQYLGESVQLRLFGFVPEDEQLNRATRLGQPIISAFPQAEAAIAFRQLADVLLRWSPTQVQESPASFVHHLVESSRILASQIKH